IPSSASGRCCRQRGRRGAKRKEESGDPRCTPNFGRSIRAASGGAAMSTRTHWAIHFFSLILLCGMGIFIVLRLLPPVPCAAPPLEINGAGEEQDRDEISRDEISDDEISRIKYLINTLASRNAEPKRFGSEPAREIKFDPPYDKNLQVPVYLAVQQLFAEG